MPSTGNTGNRRSSETEGTSAVAQPRRGSRQAGVTASLWPSRSSLEWGKCSETRLWRLLHTSVSKLIIAERSLRKARAVVCKSFLREARRKQAASKTKPVSHVPGPGSFHGEASGPDLTCFHILT